MNFFRLQQRHLTANSRWMTVFVFVLFFYENVAKLIEEVPAGCEQRGGGGASAKSGGERAHFRSATFYVNIEY